MAYLGNPPEVNTYTLAVQKFNGTGACTQFTLTRNISDANTLYVVVNGVPQTPVDSYSVTNGLLTFTEAPNSGTNNITITYLATSLVTYSMVSSSQLMTQAVTTQALAPDAITTDKIADGAVQNSDLGINSVSGDKIIPSTITGNLIANSTIQGNAIATPADIFDDAFLFGGM